MQVVAMMMSRARHASDEATPGQRRFQTAHVKQNHQHSLAVAADIYEPHCLFHKHFGPQRTLVLAWRKAQVGTGWQGCRGGLVTLSSDKTG